MKYATMIFIKVLSGLCQQQVVNPEKKIAMIETWKASRDSKDISTMKKLLDELYSITSNQVWRGDLNRALESLL